MGRSQRHRHDVFEVQREVAERIASALQLELSDAEKQAVWEEVKEAVPQLEVYETRTDRNIRLYHLTRA